MTHHRCDPPNRTEAQGTIIEAAPQNVKYHPGGSVNIHEKTATDAGSVAVLGVMTSTHR